MELDPSETIYDWNNHAMFQLQKQNALKAICILLRLIIRLSYDGDLLPVDKAVLKETGRICRIDVSRLEALHRKSNSKSGCTCPSTTTYSQSMTQDAFLISVPMSTATVDVASNNTRHRQRLLSSSAAASVYEDNMFVMFEDAFVTIFREDDGKTKRKLSVAIILYNMGLALHLYAKACLPHKSEPLKLALKFYHWSLETLEEDCGDGCMLDTVFVLLALFNNLGHIYSGGVLDVERAMTCSQWLRELRSAKSVHLATFLQKEYAFFCQSMITPPGSEFPFAPAA